MFDCFVDQDVVSALSDLYHSLTFKNLKIDDKKNFNGLIDNNNQFKMANIVYLTSLYSGSKAIKTLYPNKYMFAWKLATDDLFMRGYNSSKIKSRTNIQNDFKQFIGTRAYPDPTKASITPCRITCVMPDVIGELAGGAIKPQ
ncbi:MAG: hypothetical protein EZS28_000839 [Streblomastix strix]|uniref:Uncharacterized protein n=1 Tax=Streblomastix strix TaxID=222440 RepID=A0A5J4X987_9EUKA|nr:MAG: hypothetical protein EZS28_000839 [Streblomastix strix]